MKKYLILFLLCIVLTGCSNKEEPEGYDIEPRGDSLKAETEQTPEEEQDKNANDGIMVIEGETKDIGDTNVFSPNCGNVTYMLTEPSDKGNVVTKISFRYYEDGGFREIVDYKIEKYDEDEPYDVKESNSIPLYVEDHTCYLLSNKTMYALDGDTDNYTKSTTIDYDEFDINNCLDVVGIEVSNLKKEEGYSVVHVGDSSMRYKSFFTGEELGIKDELVSFAMDVTVFEDDYEVEPLDIEALNILGDNSVLLASALGNLG